MAIFGLPGFFMELLDPEVFTFPCWVSGALRVTSCGTSPAGTWLPGGVGPRDRLDVLVVTGIKPISLNQNFPKSHLVKIQISGVEKGKSVIEISTYIFFFRSTNCVLLSTELERTKMAPNPGFSHYPSG